MPGHETSLTALWRSRSLRWGVMVAAMVGCSLLAMFGLMYWRSSVLLFDTLDRSVSEQLELLSARPPEMLPFMIASRMNRGPEVVTAAGLFSAAHEHIVGDLAVIPKALTLNGRVQAIRDDAAMQGDWRVAGRILPDGRILLTARDASEIIAVRATLAHGAVAGILPAILLCLGAGIGVGLTTERRLRQLNAAAERIIEGELGERLPTRNRGDELDRLCVIVNRMLDRLEAGVAELQGAGEDIAHDIRTPLTALRARLERALSLAQDDPGQAALLEQSCQNVDETLSIVTALLRIADIRHVHRKAAFAAVDLADILRETGESYQPLAEDRGVSLTWSIETASVVTGDRQLLVEAVVNLVDNAVKFTPSGGQVALSLSGGPAKPVIRVRDTGPGIPATARLAVFQRFHRQDAARTTSGHGLGLSLVAAVARLHRFDIVIEDSTSGCCMALHCWANR